MRPKEAVCPSRRTADCDMRWQREASARKNFLQIGQLVAPFCPVSASREVRPEETYVEYMFPNQMPTDLSTLCPSAYGARGCLTQLNNNCKPEASDIPRRAFFAPSHI